MSVVAVIAAISAAVHSCSPADAIVGISVTVDGTASAACSTGRIRCASIPLGTAAPATAKADLSGATVAGQAAAAAATIGGAAGIAATSALSASRAVSIERTILDGQRGLVLTG